MKSVAVIESVKDFGVRNAPGKNPERLDLGEILKPSFPYLN
jgi:hypothetical protein